jgi:ferric-dicitrate binding protein FerR (iron transport regulator)
MNPNGLNIDLELIARHLSGETSEAEEQKLSTWLESGDENRNQFEEFKTLWERMDKVSSIASLDIEAEWKTLESRIEREASGQSHPAAPSGEKAGKSRSMIFMVSRIAVAALVIIALAIGGLYTSRNMGNRTLLTAELAEELILPDGSIVTLNSHSSLTYPKKFKQDRRDVSLKGEGFFEVNGDPEWPFIITTAEIDIRVLGTSFNVNAYESNTEVEVVVKTGEVAVTRRGEVPKTIILKPGSKAVFDRAEEDLRLSTSIDKNYLAWKTRSFVFEDEALMDVAAALNRVYASEIIIPSDSLQEARITSTFNEQSLDAILNVLSATLDIEVLESGGKIILKESN